MCLILAMMYHLSAFFRCGGGESQVAIELLYIFLIGFSILLVLLHQFTRRGGFKDRKITDYFRKK
jgi:hypothetical protein